MRVWIEDWRWMASLKLRTDRLPFSTPMPTTFIAASLTMYVGMPLSFASFCIAIISRSLPTFPIIFWDPESYTGGAWGPFRILEEEIGSSILHQELAEDSRYTGNRDEC